MQNQNEDTEWNDVLRAKGIIPQKEKEISEDDVVKMLEDTIQKKSSGGKDQSEMTLNELNEAEDDFIDDESERILLEYKRKRILEMKEAQKKAIFGDVKEISKCDWVSEVNQAGDGIWVIVHVYKQSIPLCKRMNEFVYQLARKFPATKFLKSVSEVCIPNYPDKNLPTIFVYQNGDLKKQFVGPIVFRGMKLSIDELEWMLHETGAIETTLEENPRKAITDMSSKAIFHGKNDVDSDDDNDW